MYYLYGCLAVIGGMVLIMFLFWLAIRRAPHGYEDEDGFHYGDKNDK